MLMPLARLFRSVFGSRPVASKSPPRRRLALESLEDRLTPSGGLLDASWSFPTSTGTVAATAVQSDGKVVAVGLVRLKQYGETAIWVARMNPNGSFDTSFNGTGSTTVNVPHDSHTVGLAVTLQPDGKILVGGDGTSSDVVARLNANGTLDTTFGNIGPRGVGGGIWVSPTTSGNWAVLGLTLLSDGSIIGGGEGTTASGLTAFAAFKLTPTGTLNSSFGTGGLTIVHISGGSTPDTPKGLAVTASGEVVLAGYAFPAGASVSSSCLVALTPTGQLDRNFNGTGYLTQNFGPSGNQYTEFDAVAAQGNTIIAAGVVDGSDWGLNQGLVARYTLSGALDPTFGSLATPGYFLAAADSHFTAVGLEPDGTIALGGWGYYMTPNGWTERGLVSHLSANGVLDTSFGSDGSGVAYYGVLVNASVTMSIAPDGSLLLSGRTDSNPQYNAFAHFTAG
jgi:uncharacterized delta-60 repeat protein